MQQNGASPTTRPEGWTGVSHSVAGLVTIHLEDPPPGVLAALRHELGESWPVPVGAAPDIRVSFVDAFAEPSELRFLDRDQAAYDTDAFYLVDPAGARTRLALGAGDLPATLVCERSVAALPLLVPLVGLAMLAKDAVLLHSGACVQDGLAVLIAGWKKGGKTEIMLPLVAAGAQFMSDEWTVVTGSGELRGMPGVVHVWSWHLGQLPALEARIPRADQRRLKAVRLYQRLYPHLPLPEGGPIGHRLKALSREGGVAWVAQARCRPEDLFGSQVRREPARVGLLLMPNVGPLPSRAIPTTGTEVVSRMLASLAYERTLLMTAYQMLRFAFPERVCPALETASERERDILDRALGHVPSFEVVHPYPVDLLALRDVVRPLIPAARAATAASTPSASGGRLDRPRPAHGAA